MAIDITASAVTCSRCGKEYGSARTHFHTSYATSYKGIRRLTICKHCVESLFDTYYNQCGNYKDAMRQMCRKLDLYWNETQFNVAESRSTPRTLFNTYMSCINTPSLAGKCYDDTLVEEGRLWGFVGQESAQEDPDGEVEKVSDEVKAFWGSGLPESKYRLLEERMNYILQKLKLNRDDIDIGAEMMLKQACGLELDIADARAEGKPVDKLVNSFNTVIGGLNLKPAQQKSDNSQSASVIPLGVMAKIYENKRPINEVHPDLQDIDKIFETTSTFMFGHTAKMLQQSNVYSRAYEKVMNQYRIDNDMEDADDDDVIEAMLADRADQS